MPTGTQGKAAREYTQHQVHYAGIDFTYEDNGKQLSLGYAPAGASVIRGGVVVSEAFDAGTSNLLDIGTADDPDGYATDLALDTVGVIPADEMATTDDAGPFTEDKELVCTPTLSGTAATAGKGRAWVEYILSDMSS